MNRDFNREIQDLRCRMQDNFPVQPADMLLLLDFLQAVLEQQAQDNVRLHNLAITAYISPGMR